MRYPNATKYKKWWKHTQTIWWIDADACVYYVLSSVLKFLLQKQTLQDGSQIIERVFMNSFFFINLTGSDTCRLKGLIQ